ncbi:MAG: DUF5678 domain-containing protein [Bacteroides sp.]|nr:DUF5678 domain-containing protein [Ruminococcus flavefaciens]MCM1555438.1 DUF5678 domain-containing protein [Bacteroides sp.]
MADLDKLFEWYLANQDELVSKYNGKYLVIKDNSVVETFDSEDEAFFRAAEKYGLGNFIVQLCTPGQSAYTINICSSAFAF